MNPQNSSHPMDTNTRLSYHRTYLSWERTQMSWVRTALALISFGFTISKFFEYLNTREQGQHTVFSARTVGLLMIAIGMISLVFSSILHRKALLKLKADCPDLPNSVAGLFAWLISLLAIPAFIGACLKW